MSIWGTAASTGTRAVPSGWSGRSLVAVFALAVASMFVSGAGASGNRAVTLYSVATGLQYINTEDDRARGRANNPLDKTTKKLAPKSSDSGNGPFAGDVAIYALNLYRSRALKQRAGSAVYTCYFNYDQHALCKAYFTLAGGDTLVASGPDRLLTSGFTIVVTGGTNKYFGVRGEVKAVSGQGHSKLAFRLIG